MEARVRRKLSFETSAGEDHDSDSDRRLPSPVLRRDQLVLAEDIADGQDASRVSQHVSCRNSVDVHQQQPDIGEGSVGGGSVTPFAEDVGCIGDASKTEDSQVRETKVCAFLFISEMLRGVIIILLVIISSCFYI